MNSYDYIFLLKKLSLFDGLPLDVVKQLVKKGKLLQFNHANELTDLLLPETIFIMLKGKIELLNIRQTHDSFIVAQWTERDIIPNYHKDETFSRFFKAKVVDDSILLQLPIRLFLSNTNQHPQMHLPLLKLRHLNLTFSYRILSNYSHLLQKKNDEMIYFKKEDVKNIF